VWLSGDQKRAFLEPIPCNAPRSGFMIMRRLGEARLGLIAFDEWLRCSSTVA
jgi:hypothetical protein